MRELLAQHLPHESSCEDHLGLTSDEHSPILVGPNFAVLSTKKIKHMISGGMLNNIRVKGFLTNQFIWTEWEVHHEKKNKKTWQLGVIIVP